MSLYPKPFDPNEKIRNRIYLPEPGRITAVDLNQEKEALLSSMEFNNHSLGAFSKGVFPTINTLTLIKTAGPIYTLNYDIDLAGSTPKIFAKTVEFDPFTGGSVNFTGTEAASAPRTVMFWLIAEKITVDFIADPVMSGVDGVGFPGPLSSSDTIVWGNESIVTVAGSSNPPTVTGNFEVICSMGSIVYRDDRYLGIPNDFTPIFIPELVDYENFTDSIFELWGQQTLVPRGSKAKDVLGILQRMSLLINDGYSKISNIRSFTGVLTVTVNTNVTASNIGKIIFVSGATGSTSHYLPEASTLKDGDNIVFVNNANEEVNILPFGGDSIANYTSPLMRVGDFIQLVLDKPNSSWVITNHKITLNPLKGINFITSAGTTTLTLATYNFHHVINSSGNVALWLYADSDLKDRDFVTIYNNSNYSVSVRGSSSGILGTPGIISLNASGDFLSMVYDKNNTRWVIVNSKITIAPVTLTPLGTWTVYNPGTPLTPKYKTIGTTISLQGAVQKSPDNSGTLFVVPSPSVDRHGVCMILDGPNYTANLFTVATNGNFTITTPSVAGTNVIVWLDSISYDL